MDRGEEMMLRFGANLGPGMLFSEYPFLERFIALQRPASRRSTWQQRLRAVFLLNNGHR
jgi:hypothetical protein